MKKILILYILVSLFFLQNAFASTDLFSYYDVSNTVVQNDMFVFRCIPLFDEFYILTSYDNWCEKRLTTEQMVNEVKNNRVQTSNKFFAYFFINYTGEQSYSNFSEKEIKIPNDFKDYIFLDNANGQSVKCQNVECNSNLKMVNFFLNKISFVASFEFKSEQDKKNFLNTPNMTITFGGLDYKNIKFKYNLPIIDYLKNVPDHINKIFNQSEIYSYNDFFAIANNGDIEKLNKFLINDFNINYKDKNGLTLIMHSIENSKNDLTRFIIDKNCDITIKDGNGDTALFYAIKKKQNDLALYLISINSKEVETINNSGYTPLIYASINKNSDIINSILEKNIVNINSYDNQNNTALFYAIDNNDTDTVKILLNKKININHQNSTGQTALFNAINNNNLNFVKLLLSNGANVNIFDKTHKTPLIKSIEKGNIEILKTLIENKADINAKDNQGNTPILNAAINKSDSIFDYLLNSGANCDLVNNDGHSLIHFIDNYQLFLNLKTKGVKSPLVNYNIFMKIYNSGIDTINFLINLDTDSVNLRNIDNDVSLLMKFCENGDYNTSKFLISKGADVNLHDRDNKTAIFYAIQGPNLNCIKLLLENSSEVNVQAKNGITPLMKSVLIGDYDKTELLLSYNSININTMDNEGDTALHMSVLSNNIKISKLLISRGADQNLVNKNGLTPLDRAKRNKNKSMINYFKSLKMKSK